MKAAATRMLVDMLVEAASECGEAHAVEYAVRLGRDTTVDHEKAMRTVLVTQARRRTVRDALLIALDVADPTDTVPF